mmetsp:Transcript_19396/g.40756  ORF Transcript_19396/g.40756 Transcript_19396/m.40756 type:complete len:406 (-) Transcript_19396:240-1457(-)
MKQSDQHPDKSPETLGLIESETSWKPAAWIVKLSRISLYVSCALTILLGVTVVWYLISMSSELHVIGWTVGLIFVAVAVPLSLHDIHMHLLHYVSPLQRFYIRVIWMVPIYAVQSWLALRFKGQKVYLETLREAYESWVIYSFFMLMLEFSAAAAPANEADKAAAEEEAWEVEGPRAAPGMVHMLFPFCWLRPWRRDTELVPRAQLGVFQYVFIRLAFSIIVLIAEPFGGYAEGCFDCYDRVYFYKVVAVNVSQGWAMYCLILFYHEKHAALAPLRPLGKLLAVKAVVFASFWQGVLIAGLVSQGRIRGTLFYTEDEVANGLQDFLICIEMALAAVAHKFTYTYRDFMEGGSLHDWLRERGALRRQPLARAAAEMLPVRDARQLVPSAARWDSQPAPDPAAAAAV